MTGTGGLADAKSLRPRHADDLGLRRALSDRLLPALVAAMVFLAVLALAGTVAAHGLALRWQGDAAAMLTVQVPDPDGPAAGATRAETAARLLASAPGVLASHRLTKAEIGDVLSPWLGPDAAHLSLALPAVFEVHATPGAAAGLDALLAPAAPGTLVEANGLWFERLARLAGSLQACAVLALALVAFVAAAVVAVATRAGLAARREAIEIVHGLGATDGMIAGRFASRLTLLTVAGALIGVLCALPMLLGLASLAAPFAPDRGLGGAPGRLPAALWESLPVLPLAAAAIGWGTAQVTVRSWLARLP